MHAGPLQGPSLRPLFRLSLTRCSIFALTRCYLRPQDVDPKAVTFYERDVEGEQKPMAIPAEKLEQGWLAVLQYIRELREQVRRKVLNRWKGDRTVTQAENPSSVWNPSFQVVFWGKAMEICRSIYLVAGLEKGYFPYMYTCSQDQGL